MDYTFMGDDGTAANENPTLASYDNGTCILQVHVTKKKGVLLGLPQAIGKDLDGIGYGGCRITLKSDQEKPIGVETGSIRGQECSYFSDIIS